MNLPHGYDEPCQILVADDDAMLLGMLKEVISSAGLAVATAPNGRVALERCRANPPYLLITDVLMPEMDGIALIAAVKAELPAVPIIVMSGGTAESQSYLDMAVKAGAAASLSKPFPITQLMSTILACVPKPRILGIQESPVSVETAGA